jgi:hypothetical protein
MAITSPFRTSTELITLVLQRSGLLSIGNSPDLEDVANVNTQLDSIYRKIAGLEIAYVSDPNNIPGAWFSDLADIVAGECGTSLGIVGEELTSLVNKGLGGVGGVEIGAGTAAKSLKIMTRGRPTYEVQRIQNF